MNMSPNGEETTGKKGENWWIFHVHSQLVLLVIVIVTLWSKWGNSDGSWEHEELHPSLCAGGYSIECFITRG